MARLTAARGLVTSSSELTRADGALTVADNVNIDYENIIQQRRGNKEYSQDLTNPPKQAFTYKSKILTHYGTLLAFDSSTPGTFTDFSGNYSELINGLRIKALEANGNCYFTTDEGIKKISVASSSDLPSTTIINSGAAEAIDLDGVLIPDSAGFLPAQSKVSYKLLFGYKDANNNLQRGVPSSRVLLTNQAQDTNSYEIFTANVVDHTLIVDLDYFTFDTMDTGYFAWFKKTATSIAPVNADTLDREGITIDISDTAVSYTNDIVAAVIANSLSNAVAGIAVEVATSEVQVTLNTAGDATDVDQGNLAVGAVLLTKVFDGSIITGMPAKAELTFTLPEEVDTTYFYQIHRTAVVTVSAGVTLNDIDPGDEHQFVYEAPITSADVTAGEITIGDNTPEAFRAVGEYLYTNAITGEGITQANERPPIAQDIAPFRNSTFYANTKDFHKFTFSMLSVDNFVSGATKLSIKQGIDLVEYFFVGVPEVIDINVTAKSTTTENTYIVINSANNERSYYLWMDKGTGTDPAVTGKLGVRIPLELYADTQAGSKQALLDALLELPDFTAVDFDADTVRITCVDAGNATDPTESATPTGWTFSVVTQGDGEDVVAKEVLLSQSSSVGVAINLTARSLVKVINRDVDSPVTATYLSGVDDLPGKILLKAKSLADVNFYVAINDVALVTEFSPEIPYWDGIATFPITAISDNNEVPNRIYYSKLNQPEAVPALNYIDVGSKDKQILRILPLRDSLFVLKDDGIFTVTGSSPANFSVKLLDNSAILIAPDSAVVLNNLIYCLSTQGVISISDSGVSIVSRAIEDQIKKVTTFAYNFRYTSFGVSYESDRAYLLWLPTEKTDTVATQCFRYSTITNTWTRWTISATCGIVNYLGDDRMYLGSGSGRDYILQERKNNERQDAADRDFVRSLGENAVDEDELILSSVVDVEDGDVITQQQYLTIPKFNRFLKKLDNDSGPALDTYYANFAVTQGVNFANSLIALVTQLNTDVNLVGGFTVPSGVNTLAALQTDFNLIIDELNDIASGTFFKDYKQVTDLLTYEVEIVGLTRGTNIVTVDRSTWFIQGEISVYKHIATEVEYAPQHFGKPEEFKQIIDGTVIFDQGTISRASVGYASDRSLNFVDINFTLDGPGFWACFPWISIPFGGGSNERPVRTLIPQNKARCRYLHVRFKHAVARQQYKLLGISLEPREVSKRAYR